MTEKKERKAKAPARTKAQIAQDNLDGARHRLGQKRQRWERLDTEKSEVEAEIRELEAEVAYLAQSPYLPVKGGEETPPGPPNPPRSPQDRPVG